MEPSQTDDVLIAEVKDETVENDDKMIIGKLQKKRILERVIAEDAPTEMSATEMSNIMRVTSVVKGDHVSTSLPAMHGAPTTSREMLNKQTQILIDEINSKRKRDTALLSDFKKALEVQASNTYSMVEQNVFQLYEHNSKQLQDKLQELFTTLDRICKLEAELDQFKMALGALYNDVH